MSVSSQGMGQVITFYTYKGGVGRSMALVNIGVLLARGEHKVLLIDWDLEAPGLDEYFKSPKKCVLSSDRDKKPGVVDLLLETDREKGIKWRDCLITAKFPGGNLDLISAGRRDKKYQGKLRKLDWGVLYESYHIGDFLEEMRSELKGNYDFILIDSRTGITDIGDICTVLLPDTLITIFTSNNQNIDGCETVVERARAARRKLPVNRNKLIVVPLASRDESDSEYEEATVWRKRFATRFKKYLSEWLPQSVTTEEYFNRLYIPYVPVWSFGERIPVLESQHELRDPKTIGASYLVLSRLIESDLEWFSAPSLTEIDDLKSKQAEIRVAEESYEKLARDQRRLKNKIDQLNLLLKSSDDEKHKIAIANKKLEAEQRFRQKEIEVRMVEAEARQRFDIAQKKQRVKMFTYSAFATTLFLSVSFGIYSYSNDARNTAIELQLKKEINRSRAESADTQRKLIDLIKKLESLQRG